MLMLLLLGDLSPEQKYIMTCDVKQMRCRAIQYDFISAITQTAIMCFCYEVSTLTEIRYMCLYAYRYNGFMLCNVNKRFYENYYMI